MNNKSKTFLESFTSFVLSHHKKTLVFIVLLTLFFAFEMRSIRINANVFSLGIQQEPTLFIKTPDTPPSFPLVLEEIGKTGKIYKRGETAPKVYNRMPGVDIPPPLFEEKVVANNPSLIIHDSDESQSYPDGYVIIFSSEKMFEKETLNRIYEVRKALSERWEIGPCLSPFDFVTVEKKGSRLSIVPIAPVKDGEVWTDEDASVFKERLFSDTIAKNYLFSEDGKTIMIYYRARGLSHSAIEELNSITDALREYGHVALSGGGLISDAVLQYLNRDLILLALLSLILILIVYYLSFRSLKAMLIPFSLSLIAIIWTLGAMAFLNYDLTIVTILTPCLVLTLGSSYSIHVLSEYIKALKNDDKKNIVSYHARTIRTILFAALTTIAGFLSFLICESGLLRDFGITVSIGVFFCAFLSFTYLPSLLASFPADIEVKAKSVKDGKVINKTALVIVKRWPVFIFVFLAITVLFFAVKDKIGFDSNYMNYFPQDSQIAKDSIYFARTLGGTNPYYLTIKAPEGSQNFFLRHENLSLVYSYERALLASCPDIVQILSFSQYVSFLNEVYSGDEGIPESNGLINLLSRTLLQLKSYISTNVLDALISEDGNEITLSMRNYNSESGDLQTLSSERRVEKTLDYYRYMLPEGTESRIWCFESDNIRAVDIIMKDQRNATLLSLLLIFLISTLAFKSPAHGLLVLFPISTGVMINYLFMALFNISFDLVTVGFTSIAMGAGVDDSIHFLLRYRMRKKEKKETLGNLIYQNITETGRPIILTTLSVDAGLLTFLFASFIPVKYFGAMMAVSLTGAMLSTLFILPSIIFLCDKILTVCGK